MNLDDLDLIRSVDPAGMLPHIDALPDQFENAWELAQKQPLPDSHRSPRRIVLCGMGGSAIGGDLAAALVSETSPVSITVLRGYTLPAYVSGSDVLLIASSHSGGTEETLSAVEQAASRGVRILAISTGGKLAEIAKANGYPLWQYSYTSQPRAALGWSFGTLIGLAHRLGLSQTLEADLKEAVSVMRASRGEYGPNSPAVSNPAKRGAGQIIGRIPVIYGAGYFAPVARRWKGQINENAKAWAQYEELPEANHNAVVGIEFPEELMRYMVALFISSPTLDHPRVTLRHNLTYQLCMQHGIMADKFSPRGSSALAQMCHAIQYGDYMSYYAAMAYKVDPTPVKTIMELKALMARQ